MDAEGLDFTRGGSVFLERYTVNQLTYIARCIREQKSFAHLIKGAKVIQKADGSTSTDVTKEGITDELCARDAVAQNSTSHKDERQPTRRSSRRSRVAASPSSGQSLEPIEEVKEENEKKKSPLLAAPRDLPTASEKPLTPEQSEASSKFEIESTCGPPSLPPVETPHVANARSSPASSLETAPTMVTRLAPCSTVSTALPVAAAAAASQIIPQNDTISCTMNNHTTLSSRPLQANMKVALSVEMSPRSKTTQATPSNDEFDKDKYCAEAVMRSLVNSVLVEEEDRLARERGLDSARNPFASAGLQKYLRENRDLKMTYLGLAAPNLGAAISPNKAVVSTRGTENVLLKGIARKATSSTFNSPSTAPTSIASPMAPPSAVSAGPERAKSLKRKDSRPVVSNRRAAKVSSTSTARASTRGAASTASTSTEPSIASVSEVAEKRRSKNMNASTLMLDPKPQLVPPLRLKIPASLIRPPTPIEGSEQTSDTDTDSSSAEKGQERPPGTDPLQNVGEAPADLNIVDGTRQRSMMHRVKTIPSSRVGNTSGGPAGTDQTSEACAEDLAPMVLHTSDARMSQLWNDEKASRVLRQSLLVIAKGARVAVTKYNPNFVSLPLTLNSCIYAASATVTSDDLARQNEQRRTHLLDKIATTTKDDSGSGGNASSQQGVKRSCSDPEINRGQPQPARILKWSKQLGYHTCSSISQKQGRQHECEQQSAIPSQNQMVIPTEASSSLSPSSLPSSSVKSIGMTRRGRTVKRNSRLADYLVGERVLKRCEEEVEQRARERNRQVELEYARQWHALRNQLTATAGAATATPSDDSSVSNSSQLRHAGPHDDKGVPPVVRPAGGNRVLAGSVESLSSSDDDEREPDSGWKCISARDRHRYGDYRADAAGVSTIVNMRQADLDNKQEEHVVLPQKESDQHSEYAGGRTGHGVGDAAVEATCSVGAGQTIAPVSFPLDMSLLEFELRNSRNAVTTSAEEDSTGLPARVRGDTDSWQEELDARGPMANWQFMSKTPQEARPDPALSEGVRPRQVIMDPDLSDVAMEEIAPLEELNNLLYDKPGIVTAGQLLHDLRKAFCIEVRNHIQLLRYKKLLTLRNQQLKRALRGKIVEPSRKHSRGGQKPSTVISTNGLAQQTVSPDRRPSKVTQPLHREISQGVLSGSPVQLQRQQQEQPLLQPNIASGTGHATGQFVYPIQTPVTVSNTRCADVVTLPSTANGSSIKRIFPRSQGQAASSFQGPLRRPSLSSSRLLSLGSGFSQTRPVVTALSAHTTTDLPRAIASVFLSPPSSQSPPVTSRLRFPTSTNPIVPISPIIPAGQIFMMMPSESSHEPGRTSTRVVEVDSPRQAEAAAAARTTTTFPVRGPGPTLMSAPQNRCIIKRYVQIRRTPSVGGEAASVTVPAAVVSTPQGSARPTQLVRFVTPHGLGSNVQMLRAQGPPPWSAGRTNSFRCGGATLTPVKRYVSSSTTDGVGGVHVIESSGLRAAAQPAQLNSLNEQSINVAGAPAGSVVIGKRQSDKSLVAFTERDGSTVTKTLAVELDFDRIPLERPPSTSLDGDEYISPPRGESAHFEQDQDLIRQRFVEHTAVTTVSASGPEREVRLARGTPLPSTSDGIRAVSLCRPTGANSYPSRYVRLVPNTAACSVVPATNSTQNVASHTGDSWVTPSGSQVAVQTASPVVADANKDSGKAAVEDQETLTGI